jgi:hypothetical protein
VRQYSGACARHFANPKSLGAWVEDNTDASVKTALAALTARQANAVRDGVPTARVIELPNTNHIVFLSNEADVLRAR